jgi:hypothetical protein
VKIFAAGSGDQGAVGPGVKPEFSSPRSRFPTTLPVVQASNPCELLLPKSLLPRMN